MDEVAVALSISGAAAGQRLHLALDLHERLPATLAALERGEIDLLRARAISDGTRPLTGEHAAEVERRVLTRAAERRIVLTPADDGMAELWAYLPADQRRADAFIDLLLGESTTGPVAQVQVVVPAGTLLGLDDEPGELAGYGPIPANLARGTRRRQHLAAAAHRPGQRCPVGLRPQHLPAACCAGRLRPRQR